MKLLLTTQQFFKKSMSNFLSQISEEMFLSIASREIRVLLSLTSPKKLQLINFDNFLNN